jgi:hypothetical protein
MNRLKSKINKLPTHISSQFLPILQELTEEVANIPEVCKFKSEFKCYKCDLKICPARTIIDPRD